MINSYKDMCNISSTCAFMDGWARRNDGFTPRSTFDATEWTLQPSVLLECSKNPFCAHKYTYNYYKPRELK